MPKSLFVMYSMLFKPPNTFSISIDNSNLTPLALLAARTAGDFSDASDTGFKITRNGYTFEFLGHDLTYGGDGNPNGGTVTELSVVSNGTQLYYFTTGNVGDGLNLSAAAFNSVFGGTDPGAIAQTLFRGDDMIQGGTGPNHLYGYAGNDQVYGNNSNDVLYGNAGNDLLAGGAAIDRLYGGTGNDWLSGGTGNDILDGGTGHDTALYVRLKQSVVVTLNGDKPAKAHIGLSEVDTLKNIENVYGGVGNDRLTGDNRGNRLDGYAGTDTLNGRGGNDIISGGWDNDRLTGGPGADKFYFDTQIVSRIPNIDTITDFQRGIDKIYLDVSVFHTEGGSLPLGRLSADNFLAGKGVTHGKGNDYIVYDTSTGNLFFDTSGNGGLTVQFAHLNGAPKLTAADFVVADIYLYI